MHAHLKFVFKWALHFSALAITHFNSGTKLFQATINTTSSDNTASQFSFECMLCHPYDKPTFKTKAVCLVSDVQRV